MSASGYKKSSRLEDIQAYYLRTYRDRPAIAAIGDPIAPNWYPVICEQLANPRRTSDVSKLS